MFVIVCSPEGLTFNIQYCCVYGFVIIIFLIIMIPTTIAMTPGGPIFRPRWRANFEHPAVHAAGTVWPTYWSLRPRFPWRLWPLDSQQLVSQRCSKTYDWFHVGNLQQVGLIWLHNAWPGFGEVLLGQLFPWRPLLAFHCGALLRRTMSQGLRLCSTEGGFLGGRSSVAFFIDWINLGHPLGTNQRLDSHRVDFPGPSQVLMESFFDQLAVSAAASSAVLVTVGLLIWFSNVFQHALGGCWLWAESKAVECSRDQNELQMFTFFCKPTLRSEN